MIAIYLSPIYLLLNLYILRWAYLWMGTCHSILRTLGFRLIFAVIYVLLSTSLLTGFLIKNPKSLHRMLENNRKLFPGNLSLYTCNHSACRFWTNPSEICISCIMDSFQNSFYSYRCNLCTVDPSLKCMWNFSCQIYKNNFL